MTPLVIDASVIVAALLDDGPVGRWAEGELRAATLAAPHLVMVEVSNALRRAVQRGSVDTAEAAIAHQQLPRLAIELFPFAPLADRVWQLRSNLTAYDAWYVALAERLDAPLATIDHRLAAAPGPTCPMRCWPPSS